MKFHRDTKRPNDPYGISILGVCVSLGYSSLLEVNGKLNFMLIFKSSFNFVT
jgi:hypothetical protein